MSKKAIAEAGSVVGDKYRVGRTLGTGGMGIVYEARHIELGQRVALKLLQSVDDEEHVQRFLREAQATVRLKSEHAAKVIDVGRQKSGAPYMVMELLTGKDLGEICETQTLPPAVAVSYILQACEAVAEAHALGIVHRDLKPSNLFLTERPDGQPLVKVLDFGIAKMVRHDGNDKLTGTGTVMGSPRYMSPEQLRSSRDVDQRTDIWSLGVCLYELVSGHTPFEAPNAPELYVAVLRDEPTPIQQWLPHLDAGLAAALAKCLEKDPARRFSSVFELVSALEPFALGEARTSAARIARVLANTGRSEPPPSLERAIVAAQTQPMIGRPVSREQAALVPGRDARRGGGIFVMSALAGVALATLGGVAVFLLRTSPPAAPGATRFAEPTASASVVPVASVVPASPAEFAASSASGIPRASAHRPSSRPSVATAPGTSPRPAPSPPVTEPSATSGLKTKFE